MSDEKPILIKKVKKGGGDGHHGGAWKIAYADFVTAMMAFFLLMWLLSSTTEDQKRGIANYFNPISIGNRAGGGSGVMGGTSIQTPDSSLDSTASPMSIRPSPPKENGYGGDGLKSTDENVEDGVGANGNEDVEEVLPNSNEIVEINQESPAELEEDGDAELETAYQEEQRVFEEIKEEIKEAMKESPELLELMDNVIFEDTPEGLRIQIIDQEKHAMFPVGSDKMFDETKSLIAQVAEIIKKVPNKVSISGHTDASPYAVNAVYSNWELSSDRANASRRVIANSGIDPARIESVVGRESRELFIKDDPFSPRNRRISITLLRENKEPETKKN